MQVSTFPNVSYDILNLPCVWNKKLTSCHQFLSPDALWVTSLLYAHYSGH